MTRAYKITRLPDGYCKVAVAAWKALGDRELLNFRQAGVHRRPGILHGMR